MTDDDAYAAGVAEILALRERLRRLEKMATDAARPPADRPASFGDAIRQLSRTGSATGAGVDRLRREVAGRPEPATAPSRDALTEATRVATEGLRGSATPEAAFAAMKARQARLDTIETLSPGSSGRLDPLDHSTAKAIDRLDKLLKEGH